MAKMRVEEDTPTKLATDLGAKGGGFSHWQQAGNIYRFVIRINFSEKANLWMRGSTDLYNQVLTIFAGNDEFQAFQKISVGNYDNTIKELKRISEKVQSNVLIDAL